MLALDIFFRGWQAADEPAHATTGGEHNTVLHVRAEEARQSRAMELSRRMHDEYRRRCDIDGPETSSAAADDKVAHSEAGVRGHNERGNAAMHAPEGKYKAVPGAVRRAYGVQSKAQRTKLGWRTMVKARTKTKKKNRNRAQKSPDEVDDATIKMVYGV